MKKKRILGSALQKRDRIRRFFAGAGVLLLYAKERERGVINSAEELIWAKGEEEEEGRLNWNGHTNTRASSSSSSSSSSNSSLIVIVIIEEVSPPPFLSLSLAPPANITGFFFQPPPCPTHTPSHPPPKMTKHRLDAYRMSQKKKL